MNIVMNGKTTMVAVARFLLPTEALLGFIAIAFGISGGIGRGSLWDALASAGHNQPWMLSLCIAGLLQFGAAVVEWFGGRQWTVHVILYSSSFRAVSAFLATCVWIWVMYLQVQFFPVRSIAALVLLAPVVIGFCIWSYVENYKVRVAIHPAFKTRNMVFSR